MKNLIISVALISTIAFVTVACGSTPAKNEEATASNEVSVDTSKSESGNLKEKGLFADAPKWVLDGKSDGPSEMCVVVGTRQAKTDKLTIERAIAQSDREFSSFFRTSIVSKHTNKKVDTVMTTTHLPSGILSQIDKKRFVKDSWKPKDASSMFALVCIPKEDFDKIKNELESSEQQRESMCENARTSSDFSVWTEYLDNFPIGECASEILSKIMAYKKQNAEKDRAEIEKRYTATGKYWSDSAHFRMTWDEAKNYCENLKEGGFDGWKLPTIDDLRSLVQNCSDTVTGGACQMTDKCETFSCFGDGLSNSDCWCPKNQAEYSKLGDHGTFWSDSYVWDGYMEEDSSHQLSAYTLNFDSGGIESEMFSDLGLMGDRIKNIEYVKYYNNVRCVVDPERKTTEFDIEKLIEQKYKEQEVLVKKAIEAKLDQLAEKIALYRENPKASIETVINTLHEPWVECLKRTRKEWRSSYLDKIADKILKEPDGAYFQVEVLDDEFESVKAKCGEPEIKISSLHYDKREQFNLSEILMEWAKKAEEKLTDEEKHSKENQHESMGSCIEITEWSKARKVAIWKQLFDSFADKSWFYTINQKEIEKNFDELIDKLIKEEQIKTKLEEVIRKRDELIKGELDKYLPKEINDKKAPEDKQEDPNILTDEERWKDEFQRMVKEKLNELNEYKKEQKKEKDEKAEPEKTE